MIARPLFVRRVPLKTILNIDTMNECSSKNILVLQQGRDDEGNRVVSGGEKLSASSLYLELIKLWVVIQSQYVRFLKDPEGFKEAILNRQKELRAPRDGV